MSKKTEWPLWEVFIRGKQGLNHKHVGSLRASDHKMAIDMMRLTTIKLTMVLEI